jgi:hypothetical protein
VAKTVESVPVADALSRRHWISIKVERSLIAIRTCGGLPLAARDCGIDRKHAHWNRDCANQPLLGIVVVANAGKSQWLWPSFLLPPGQVLKLI